MGKFNYNTKKGYNLFVVSSALQKSIRRGNEKEAMWWVMELNHSGYANYAWKRLLTMTCEDIGLADIDANLRVKTLFDTWEHLKKADKRTASEANPMPLIQATLYMVRAQKSRIVDNACMYYGFFWREENIDKYVRCVPEYAHDKHTRRGKSQGFRFEHFMYESSKLYNENRELEGTKEYEDKARSLIDYFQSTYEESEKQNLWEAKNPNHSKEVTIEEGILDRNEYDL